ncbi:MAG: hypothetical protein K2H60_03555 [Muribaculaceae bacterium]|nr:hypothetical protein [Muribaculaceae bacterium]
MKQKVLKSIYLLTLILTVIVVSCTDDFPFKDVTIPEGEGTLSATVTFTPNKASNLGTTRTDGDALNDINSLCVLVYNNDEEKTLFRKYAQAELLKYTPADYKVDSDKDFDKGVDGAHTDEKTTKQVSFEIPDLPYGKYYMFAVANMGDLATYDISTVEKLQNISLIWNPEIIEENNQMFGYFTLADDAESKGFQSEEPLVFTGKVKESKIHAWLKRAASKVTVAFDPSGLNQGVTIYIRNVTLRDIPKTCLLGSENTPTSDQELYNHLSSYDNPDFTQTKPKDVVANSRLEYDAKGVITTKDENTGEDNHTGKLPTDGLRLDNSIRSAIPANAHATDAPSLFFYENNQNSYLEKKDPNYKNNTDYDKRPQTKGDDRVGATIHKPDNIKDKDKINDFKDRVPYGTYVEVEAYYISSNPGNPGEGTIKYRFMLGKDISFDYDAQRNYHYKLTLGFKGWANDPDWHIDYVITTPSIEVPSVFRVSYLYQQVSELPIKIVGNIQYLTVTITENNWAPYDPNTEAPITLGSGEYAKTYLVPDGVVATEPSIYQFQWNRDAFSNSAYLNPASNDPENGVYPKNLPPGQQRPEFGFLALHLPNRNTTTITTEYNSGANNELIAYWANNLEGERRFANDADGYHDFTIGKHPASWGDRNHSFPEDDNKYTVNEILNDNGVALENQRILMLPIWTRTKTLIQTSGFSGNNPYEAFERKAVIHIAGSFDVGEPQPKRIEKEVEVYQVKRLTNPKGVWRAHDRTETFNVTLLEPINSNAESDFQPFTSQGEWKAFIEADGSHTFSLRPNGETNGYMENGVIYGNTGSEIHFAIDFGNKVDENTSECAVVKVLYHGNQCMHKILVRKGYNAPLQMGDGKRWSSYALYQATNTGNTENGRQVFNAVLTKNPLMLGSMFRRGRQERGIFVWNNVPANTGLGPFVAPGNTPFIIGQARTGVTVTPGLTGQTWKDQWQESTWSNIEYRDDRGTSNNLGIFYALDDEGNITTDADGKEYKYRVPTFQEFQDLTDNSEFGFGVFYGSSATAPKLKAEEAYGLIDPYNEGLFDDPNGMRAVVAYDKQNGNQILFPIGRYGIGVRRMFNLSNIGGGSSYYNTFAGNLHYSDVYQPLTITRAARNLYRPIPYNLPIVSGCIYWIDQYVAANTYNNVSACLGWDMNYFNFDFNAYTDNNYQDACPMKFVIDE